MTSYEISPEILVGNVENIESLIEKDQIKKILLLTSPSIYKTLENKKVIEKLEKSFLLQVFHKISPNAPIDQLDSIKNDFTKPDLLLAVGGGSVLDSAKALSVCWDNTSVTRVFKGQEEFSKQKINVFAVPTTAGTGAELSYGAILEDRENGLKGGVRGSLVQPNRVLIDVNLYATAPSRLIAEVGFDNLTHAIETFISLQSSPIVRYQSVAAIKTIFQHLRKAVKQKNLESIEQLAISAAFMGVNLAKSSTCLPHRIQYVIGPLTNTSHAQGLVMLYKGWLPIISKSSQFNDLASRLEYTSQEFATEITKLKLDLGLEYTLSDYKISEESVHHLASKVVGKCENDPCYEGLETIKKVIQLSL